MQRLEARWYTEVCMKEGDIDHDLLKFAILNFNMVQETHQNELKDMSRWWKDLGLGSHPKLSFARDRRTSRLYENMLPSPLQGWAYVILKEQGWDAIPYLKQSAKEYFEKAAENEEAGGHYNLGVLYLKGIGVKKDAKMACTYFIEAANGWSTKGIFPIGKNVPFRDRA
ncbi:hypothetical protein IFM89_014675 [Coptis chinensis]|uniref:Uncharacterized protein n=1 Tax=Coptis chinensis TaxID=261450 RepID=A0A835LRN5_9MAGN|nr:hypothetical protein IFM89_014675 [Coptis chinensis]